MKAFTLRSLPAELAERGTRLFFLPLYSPHLDPFEQVFAKLKHLIRKSQPRSIEATRRRVGNPPERFSPAECQNYLVNSARTGCLSGG